MSLHFDPKILKLRGALFTVAVLSLVGQAQGAQVQGGVYGTRMESDYGQQPTVWGGRNPGANDDHARYDLMGARVMPQTPKERQHKKESTKKYNANTTFLQAQVEKRKAELAELAKARQKSQEKAQIVSLIQPTVEDEDVSSPDYICRKAFREYVDGTFKTTVGLCNIGHSQQLTPAFAQKVVIKGIRAHVATLRDLHVHTTSDREEFIKEMAKHNFLEEEEEIVVSQGRQFNAADAVQAWNALVKESQTCAGKRDWGKIATPNSYKYFIEGARDQIINNECRGFTNALIESWYLEFHCSEHTKDHTTEEKCKQAAVEAQSRGAEAPCHWVGKPNESDVIHEVIHVLCCKKLQGKVFEVFGNSINEGFTQVLAEEVCKDMNVEITVAYPGPTALVRSIMDKYAMPVMYEAYFKQNLDPLLDAMLEEWESRKSTLQYRDKHGWNTEAGKAEKKKELIGKLNGNSSSTRAWLAQRIL